MANSSLSIFSMLRTRMQWHQERQRLLAENVANADTPKFRPRDLSPPELDPKRPPIVGVALARTSPVHLGSTVADASQFQVDRRGDFNVRPTGNAVSLEDEMLKVAANAMDYQAATALYARGLGLIKSALGKR
jgi:flagellar basal-body rod protein FlgB